MALAQSFSINEEFFLRSPVLADAENLCIVKNNKLAALTLEKDNNGFSLEDMQNWINYHNVHSENAIFVIEDKLNYKIIGHVGLYDIDVAEKTCVFGILIGLPEYWNKGIGTLVTIKMIEIAFEVYGLNLIKLHVLLSHQAGIHLYEKLGFIRKEIIPSGTIKNGILTDIVVMELNKP